MTLPKDYRIASPTELQGPWKNRLASAKSPYLLQHAHNPVDWYPWGEEAFAEARKRDVPVFLSIGYAACHWCHVMEHESFSDPQIAAMMNRDFVNIKVDREERPDVDQVYMDAVQLMTQRGGWPSNCVAMPDGRPIWGWDVLSEGPVAEGPRRFGGRVARRAGNRARLRRPVEPGGAGVARSPPRHG